MKIVYSHFPITVNIEGKKVLVKNFQGERAARVSMIKGNTLVVAKGDDVILTGPVLTDVSQTAANIQKNSKVKNKDHRVFLDGIYKYSQSKGIEK
jgi:large subunit ribosomal protein L6